MNTSCMLPQMHTHHSDEVPAAGDEPNASKQDLAKFLLAVHCRNWEEAVFLCTSGLPGIGLAPYFPY